MPPPVLLLHGCDDRWQAFRAATWVGGAVKITAGQTPDGGPWTLYRGTTRQHPVGATAIYLLDYCLARTSIRDLASAVPAALDVVRHRTGAARVAIVGHSLGGLLGRTYAQGRARGLNAAGAKVSIAYRGDLAGLYTICSGHSGVNWVVALLWGATLGSICPQVGDLLPGSATLRDLNAGVLPANLPFENFAGAGCGRLHFFGDHDGGLFVRDTEVRRSVGLVTVPARDHGGAVPHVVDLRSAHSESSAKALPCLFYGATAALERAIPHVDGWYAGLP